MNINTKKLPLSLSDKGFWKITLSLALPIALQNMLSASFSLIDTLMVGQLGDIELSATGMAGQWSWLFGMVLFGISSGAALFAATVLSAAPEYEGKTIAVILPDTGDRYLSTEMFQS